MKISLLDSMRKSILRDLDFEYEGEDIDYDGEVIKFLSPIKVKGTLKALHGIIDIDVKVRTLIEVSCSRCLDRYEMAIDIPVVERMAKEVSEDDFDTIQLSEGDTVDVTEILTKDIISSLPIQHLCSENCKGLCQECGANLNRETCDCDRKQVDVRLEALRDLF